MSCSEEAAPYPFRQGRTAGNNAAGANVKTPPPSLATTVCERSPSIPSELDDSWGSWTGEHRGAALIHIGRKPRMFSLRVPLGMTNIHGVVHPLGKELLDCCGSWSKLARD
eukprot:5673068-Amphidinium_carterae.1